MRIRRVAIATTLLAGCTDAAPLHGLDVTQAKVVTIDDPAHVPRTVDMLFVVDRSPAFAPYADELRAGVELFARSIPG